MQDSILENLKNQGRLGDNLSLPQLKDIFVKEDPLELNERMNDVQAQKMEVLKAMIDVGKIVADNKKLLHSYLRSHYIDAIAGTKKNAGMEALELWAGAQNDDVGMAFDLYVHYKEKYNTLDKIRISLESDLSALQSRARIFSEVK